MSKKKNGFFDDIMRGMKEAVAFTKGKPVPGTKITRYEDGAKIEVTICKAPLKRRRKGTTIIHVNQHIIRANRKHGTYNPPVTVRRGRKITRAHNVEITGPSRVIHSPDNPLPCGARIWIATESEVIES